MFALQEALYTFTCGLPRASATAARAKGALRAVDMRDMVAMSILLAGFTPYLTHGLDPNVVYRGT